MNQPDDNRYEIAACLRSISESLEALSAINDELRRQQDTANLIAYRQQFDAGSDVAMELDKSIRIHLGL
jgi:hypothetical protein